MSCQSGERGEEEQSMLYDAGASKLKYPDSAHNKFYNDDTELGVMAGDFVPCPTYWGSIAELVRMRECFTRLSSFIGLT